MKACTKCKVEKDESEFWKKKRGKNGLDAQCKDCNREYVKNWYKANPVRVKKCRRVWYQKNREILLEKARIWGKENAEKRREYTRLWRKRNEVKNKS